MVESGSFVNFGEWNHFQIDLDYLADEYTVYLNGSPLATQGFVDRGLGLDGFTDADISALAAGGDTVSQAMTGTAYFDNFIVRADPASVPVSIHTAMENAEISWPSESGVMYQVQYNTNLTTHIWSNLSSVVTGSGGTTQIVDSILGIRMRFYRVVAQE